MKTLKIIKRIIFIAILVFVGGTVLGYFGSILYYNMEGGLPPEHLPQWVEWPHFIVRTAAIVIGLVVLLIWMKKDDYLFSN